MLSLSYGEVREQSPAQYNKVRQNFIKKHLKYFRDNSLKNN